VATETIARRNHRTKDVETGSPPQLGIQSEPPDLVSYIWAMSLNQQNFTRLAQSGESSHLFQLAGPRAGVGNNARKKRCDPCRM